MLAAVDESVKGGDRGVLAPLPAGNDFAQGAAQGEDALIAEQLVVSQALHVPL